MDEDHEALARDATAWIVRITSGDATTDDAEKLLAWRRRSAAHERAFQERVRVWKNLGPAMKPEMQRSRASTITRRSFLAAGSVTAAGAGAAVVLSGLGIVPTLDAMLSDFSTSVGEQQTVDLPDGSVVTLDGASALTVQFSPAERRVWLTSGAAVFDIASEQRPFVVAAREGETRTRRGSFSVNHAVQDVAVECLAETADVRCIGTASLKEGEAISYSDTGLSQKMASDIETAAAWRRGLLIFNDKPLADVVADLNRHRVGKVMIARSDLRSRHVSGVFHLDRPNEVLAHLEQTLQVRPINLVGGIVLLQ